MRLFPVFHDGVFVFHRPCYEGIDVRQQRVGTRCQGIFHPWRHFRVNRAGHVAVLLQRAECYGQHLLGDVRHFALQFLEAYSLFLCLVQRVNNQKRPFVTDAGQDVPYRAVGK